MNEFNIREAREEDRDEILAFTAHTWESGDYIKWVFNDWLADTTGQFLVAEHVPSGKIAAIDKLTLLSPTDAWFEGLRVAAEFRGRGLAARLQIYMLAEAKRLGVTVARLLTSEENRTVQRMANNDGFVMCGIFRFWKWVLPPTETGSEDGLAPNKTLRRASPDESGSYYDAWRVSSAFRSAGLCHRNWSFSSTSREEWSDRAGRGDLWIPLQEELGPQNAVLIEPRTNAEGYPFWIISAVSAHGNNWEKLLSALVVSAYAEGITEINGLMPCYTDNEDALDAAGFVPEDDGVLCLFEVDLI